MSAKATSVRIADIAIGPRHRVDLGDIAGLARSLATLGLLHPIGITPEGELVFGQRRLEAARSLGWKTIDARVVDVDALLAERDENLARKDFTPSERVSIAEAVRERIGERRGRPSEENPRKCAEIEPGRETREHAAEAAGFSSKDEYRRAKTVVERGAPELVDAMDSGELAVSAAALVAGLPLAEQVDVVHQVVSGEARSVADALKKRAISERKGYDSDEWYTPPTYLDAAREVMGGIDLDPASCAKAQETVRAERFFTKEDDGLEQVWEGRVWLNPPYSQPLASNFVAVLLGQIHHGHVSQAILLQNAQTDTRWFHACLAAGAWVCLVKGRIAFLDPTGKPVPGNRNAQAFFYFGDDEGAERFVDVFRRFGAVGRLIGPRPWDLEPDEQETDA